MDSGVEKLREQLASMDQALQAFDDPVVNQLPGLRLMHRTLEERREHIGEQIAKNETCSVTVTVHQAAREDRAVSVPVLLAILEPITQATAAAATAHAQQRSPAVDPAVTSAAAELHVAELTISDGNVELLLTRSPGDLRAQLTDPDSSAPIVEHALTMVTAALAGEDGPPELLAPLQALAGWVVRSGFILDWRFEGFVLPDAHAQLDRATAHRLLERDEG